MARLEAMVARLPEAVRVDIEAWDGEPTFRVRGKNFVFTDREATGISVKLSKEEAAAVVATDALAEPTGYGLGRHGWVSVRIGRASAARWRQVEEWVRTSYTLVAPKKLANQVLAEDAETNRRQERSESDGYRLRVTCCGGSRGRRRPGPRSPCPRRGSCRGPWPSFHEPMSSSSSQRITSARMKPRSRSPWMTPAQRGAFHPALNVQARLSLSPVVRNVRSPSRW